MLKWQTCKREDEEENEDQIQGMQSCSADVRWEPTTAADCTISNRVNPTDRRDSAGERRTEPPPVKPKPPPGSKPPVVGAYPPPVSTKPLLPSKMRIPSTGARPQEPANTSNRLIPATSAPGNFNPVIRSHLPTDQQRLRRPPDRPMLMGGAAQVRPAATSAPVRGVSGRAPSSPPVHAPADPNVAPTARLDSTDSKAIAYRGLPQSVTSSCRQIPVNSTTHTRGGYTSLANRYPHLAGSPSQAPPHDAVHTGSREMSGMNARSPTMHSSVSSLTDSERSFTSTDVADRSWPQRYDGKERSLTRKHVRFAAEHQIHNVSGLESDSDTESQADVVRQAEVIVHVEGEPPDSNKTNVKQTINFIKNANNNSVAANRNRDFSTHSDHKHLSQAHNQIISTSKQLNSSPLASAQQPQTQSLVQPHTQGQSSMPMNNRVSQDSEKLSRPPSAQAADSELRIPPPSYRVTLQQRRVADQAAVAAAAAFAAKVAAASKVDKPSNGPKIANDSGMSLSPSSNSSADTHNIPEVSRNVPQLPSHLTTQLFGTRKPLAPSDTTTSDLDTSTTSTERPHIYNNDVIRADDYDREYVNVLDTLAGMTKAKKRSPLLELPDQVVLRILRLLPASDICNCMQVCRRLYTLGWDMTLWRTVTLGTGSQLNADAALKALTKRLSFDTPSACPMIEHLDLSGCERLTDRGLKVVARRCLELRTLDLSGCCRVTDVSLAELVTNCVSLEKLVLTGCQGISTVTLTAEVRQDTDSAHRGYGQQGQLSISHLDMSDIQELDDDGLYCTLFHCRRLKQLYLRRCPLLTDASLIHISRLCAPSLTHLSLCECRDLTDAGLQTLAMAARGLKYLSVAKCERITDNGVIAVAQKCKLRYLNARACQLTDDSLVELSEHCQNLKSLDVTKCQISDDALILLAQNCRGLRKLSIRSCTEITDQALEILAKYCVALVQLNVQHCDISADALVSFTRSRKRCVLQHTNASAY